jgi:hypothetical protein
VNSVEDDLIRRLDVKRALATRLDPRERQIIRDCCRYGRTFKESGALRGLCSARIGQILDRAERRLRVALAEPQQVSQNDSLPVGFDRAAFLRHMRGLIALREERRRWAFDADYAVVSGILQHERETKRPAAPPPPPPPPTPKPEFIEHPDHSETILNRVAFIALDAFMALLNPTEEGSETLGAMFTTYTFDYFGHGSVRNAVRIMREAMPDSASVRLSKWPMPIPPGMYGAMVTNEYAAVRALAVGAASETRLDITWDPI